MEEGNCCRDLLKEKNSSKEETEEEERRRNACSEETHLTNYLGSPPISAKINKLGEELEADRKLSS